MGTRAVVKVFNEDGNHLVSLYFQFDGYLSGVGEDLATFLSNKTVINGYALDQTSERFANGMGCLAAQIVAHFKEEIGGVYICEADDTEYYTYIVRHCKNNYGKITMEWLDADKVCFSGSPKEFLNFINDGGED
jgi:hypothetical protein